MIYLTELQWIQNLQDVIRGPFLDRFFILWNRVDSLPFYLLIISIVWYLINRTIGIRLFYIMIISAIVNELLKSLFHLPRPCQMDPSVGILCIKTYGFPSGAAQASILLSGVLIIECKQRILQILGIFFALFLCFSRIYLGVHFFTDILGGLFVGGLLLLLYAKVFPIATPYHRLLSFVLPLVPLIKGNFFLFGILIGVAIGLMFSEFKNIQMPKQWVYRIVGAVCAIVGSFLIIEERVFLPHLKTLFAIAAGLWFSTVEIWCRRPSFRA
ncbi:MAG TPA: phosphatase PAP2 family protein [Chlamydiales bacterium]|nr:phosphatase PAP2 family protein [Chlamydiales bacterium]